MEQILDLKEEQERQVNYAGFWIRVVSEIIDGIIVQAGQGALTYLALAGGTGLGTLEAIIIGLVISVLYYAIMESSGNMATLGKMAVGLKVTNLYGERISFMNAVGRYFGKILSAIILGIGYIMVAFDSKKQGLHDKLANTLVIYKN